MAYSYDARERLTRVLKTDDGSQIQSNRYDYNNRRLVKTTASGTTYFLYSAKGLIAEYDTGGSLVQGYLFGANSYSTNPILTYKKNGANLEYHYYHNDHLFTPQRLTDSTGTLSWSADYSAFGETTITKESIVNNLRFPGQYYDKDIKLAQNYFRDYSAELGRYVETDPIGFDGGVNFYGYALQHPNHYIDYNGKNLAGAAVVVGGIVFLFFFMDCIKRCNGDKMCDPATLEGRKENQKVTNCWKYCFSFSSLFTTPGDPIGSNIPPLIQKDPI